ncbi:MAG TPA: hypothetical protein VF476_11890 [Chitinophagaceae bacterium]
MKTINLNTGQNIRFTLFPDNQPHVTVDGVEARDQVRVICAITDSVKLIQLLETANALKHLDAVKKILTIPYLMAARYDRLMLAGDSFDLEVIANLVNSCDFEKVQVLDVHSEVALQLINNAENINNRFLVEQYDKQEAVLICPDKGAAKKIADYTSWNSRLKDVVYCTKSRDLSTGKITLLVEKPEECFNKNCVIIDDICDGGATFLAIASQIKPAHLSLIVTHGIFSKGFAALSEKFDEIITSDSLCKVYNTQKLRTIKIGYDHL